MKKSIQDYTEYLFHCTFTDESFDPEDHEDHLKASWELFDAYDWTNIYPIWKQYLHSHCDTPTKVINFVNLYVIMRLVINQSLTPLISSVIFITGLIWINTGTRPANSLKVCPSIF